MGIGLIIDKIPSLLLPFLLHLSILSGSGPEGQSNSGKQYFWDSNSGQYYRINKEILVSLQWANCSREASLGPSVAHQWNYDF